MVFHGVRRPVQQHQGGPRPERDGRKVTFCTLKNISWNFFLVIPIRTTNFPNLFYFDMNSTCFGQFLCPSSGVFLLSVHSAMVYVIQVLMTTSGRTRSCSEVVIKTCMTYTIAECTLSKKTPDDGQRNCPKHVEFISK